VAVRLESGAVPHIPLVSGDALGYGNYCSPQA
jgi:hypothetical protein